MKRRTPTPRNDDDEAPSFWARSMSLWIMGLAGLATYFGFRIVKEVWPQEAPLILGAAILLLCILPLLGTFIWSMIQNSRYRKFEESDQTMAMDDLPARKPRKLPGIPFSIEIAESPQDRELLESGQIELKLVLQNNSDEPLAPADIQPDDDDKWLLHYPGGVRACLAFSPEEAHEPTLPGEKRTYSAFIPVLQELEAGSQVWVRCRVKGLGNATSNPITLSRASLPAFRPIEGSFDETSSDPGEDQSLEPQYPDLSPEEVVSIFDSRKRVMIGLIVFAFLGGIPLYAFGGAIFRHSERWMLVGTVILIAPSILWSTFFYKCPRCGNTPGDNEGTILNPDQCEECGAKLKRGQ